MSPLTRSHTASRLSRERTAESTRNLRKSSSGFTASVSSAAPSVTSGEIAHDIGSSDKQRLNIVGAGSQGDKDRQNDQAYALPVRPKPRRLKSLLVTRSSLKSEQEQKSTADSSSTERPSAQRKRPSLKSSLDTLLPKLSLPKLKRKTSHQPLSAVPETPHDDPLAVTFFQQTPYSQRYGDARRAKMRQMRSYLEDSLKEEEDDESFSASFKLDVPDHLPNSPLCPLHPKHVSGGKALCPTHGRKRTNMSISSVQMRQQPLVVQRVRTAPKIVYESGDLAGEETEKRVGGSLDGLWKF